MTAIVNCPSCFPAPHHSRWILFANAASGCVWSVGSKCVPAPAASGCARSRSPRCWSAAPPWQSWVIAMCSMAPLDSSREAAPVSPAAAPVELALPEPAVSAVRSTPKNARLCSESSEDATHVVQAIQALRTERDPARAQALLNEYLKANPRGALSGDALALSIEAASAQHDPRAAEYARRYLASFPKGKYRDLAKRALEAQR